MHHPLIGVGVGGFRRSYADLTHLRGKEPKAAASHTTPITVAAENGLPGLLLLLWLVGTALYVAFRGLRRASSAIARLAFGLALTAILVHCIFYNALFEDPLSGAARARRRRRRARAGGRARVIGDVRARARPGAAHRRRRVRLRRHDGAARRGGRRGALRRLLDRDALAARGLCPDTLAREVREATAELGIPPNCTLRSHDFDVRTFPEHRQEILELLIEIWNDWRPDSSSSRRCTTSTRITRRSRPSACAPSSARRSSATRSRGTTSTSLPGLLPSRRAHVERKVAALEHYASQQHRRYANTEYVWNAARTHGINVTREYAEVFQVYRVVR